jgi:hypothetical protein
VTRTPKARRIRLHQARNELYAALGAETFGAICRAGSGRLDGNWVVVFRGRPARRSGSSQRDASAASEKSGERLRLDSSAINSCARTSKHPPCSKDVQQQSCRDRHGGSRANLQRDGF